MAFARVDGPIGQLRDDYHAAEVAWVVASANRGKRGRRPKFRDFVLKWGRGRPEHGEIEPDDQG